MIMRPITPADYNEINKWYHQRNLEGVPSEQLPAYGLMVPGVAASYLVQTDSKIAFIEGFIGNPAATKTQLYFAMEDIHAGLLKAAKEFGYKKVFIFTKHPTIVGTCEKNRYQAMGEMLIFSKEI